MDIIQILVNPDSRGAEEHSEWFHMNGKHKGNKLESRVTPAGTENAAEEDIPTLTI